MLKRPKIWVVGDSMLDVSVRSDRFRRTPEDVTVPILPHHSTVRDVDYHAGGAANVAVNLRGLGCDVKLITPVARDRDGGLLAKLLGDDIEVVGPKADRTTVKCRYYECDRLIVRHDYDALVPAALQPDPKISPMDAPDAVILTDYGKGAVDRGTMEGWTRVCREHSIPLYADPKLGRTNLWSGLRDAIFVANFDEAREFLVEPGAAKPEPEAAKRLCRRLGTEFQTRIVKCGRYGSVIGAGEQIVPISPFDPRSLYDVQGAGDTYIAAMVAAACRGVLLETACGFASVAAGVAVGVPGTATVDLPQVLEALKPTAFDLAFSHGRWGGVYWPSQCRVGANDLQRLGYTIGMTNGCFDLPLPHPGHLATIQAAARMCDFLFVAVDSDARVKALKGANRPYTPIGDRLSAVSALKGVAAAFEFDTPMDQVVMEFTPDLLVKGSDYNTTPWPEAALLDKWGGRAITVPMAPTRSTTSILAEVAR